MGEPNTLGGYLILMLSITLGLLVTSDSMKRKTFLGVLVVLIAISLLATLSRSSWSTVVSNVLMRPFVDVMTLLVCGSVFFIGTIHPYVFGRWANDIFAAYSGSGRAMPKKARIIRASFQVKFTDSKTARTVTIRPSNIAQYTRDDDSAVVEEWLVKRGFIVTNRQEDHEGTVASRGGT